MGRLLFMLLVLLVLTMVYAIISKVLRKDKEASNRKSFNEDIEEVARRVKMRQ